MKAYLIIAQKYSRVTTNYTPITGKKNAPRAPFKACNSSYTTIIWKEDAPYAFLGV
ncbi:MAG: hypothetical protein K8F30_03720 [Taibaiella sp.]|nr:hypothetical protein [Taibaiella sp.]